MLDNWIALQCITKKSMVEFESRWWLHSVLLCMNHLCDRSCKTRDQTKLRIAQYDWSRSITEYYDQPRYQPLTLDEDILLPLYCDYKEVAVLKVSLVHTWTYLMQCITSSQQQVGTKYVFVMYLVHSFGLRPGVSGYGLPRLYNGICAAGNKLLTCSELHMKKSYLIEAVTHHKIWL